MKHLASLRLAFCLLVATVLIGCAALGVPAADTFNKKLLAGYQSVQTVANSAIALRTVGRLSDADRDNVVGAARNVVAGLDIAALTAKTDLNAADAKLTATLAVLTALQQYLIAREGAK